MANLNKVFLIGNLTRDPELRQLPGGTSLCSFGMAVNRMMTLASGEQREEVCYVDLVAMGRQAEVISQYCRKGSPLFIEGRLHYEQWDDRETGKKRSRLSIRVERSQFIGAPPQSPAQGGTFAGGNPVYAQPAAGPGYAAQRPVSPAGAPANFPVPPPPSYGRPAAAPAAPAAPAAMPAFRPMPEPQGRPVPPPAAQGETPAANESEVEDDIPF